MSEKKMTLWIQQDLCIGHGMCREDSDLAQILTMGPGGWTYTKVDGSVGPSDQAGMIEVPPHLQTLAVRAAQECPGNCINIQTYPESV